MKGDAASFIIIMGVLVFGIAIAFVIQNMLATTISTGLRSTYEQDTSGVANSTLNYMQTTSNMQDGIFFVIIIAMAIGSLGSAYMVRTQPMFFIVMMLSNLVLIVINVSFSNAFGTFITGSADIASAAGNMAMTTQLMSIIPIISTVLSFLVAIVMYTKKDF